MEEASIAAVNDELSPVASGITCCRMISACRDLTDYQRAKRLDRGHGVVLQAPGGPRVCRIHRAEVKAVRGAWDTAEQELIRATDELAATTRRRTRRRATTRSGTSAGSAATSPAPRRRCARRTPRAIPAARARPRPPRGGQDRGGAQGDQRRARGDGLGPLDALAAAAGAGRDRGGGRRLALARGRVEELGALIEIYPAPALVAGREVALGRVLLAEGTGSEAGRRCARRSRAGARSGRRTRSPAPVRCSRGACGWSTTRTTPTSSCGPPSRSSGGWARWSTPRRRSGSCGTPRSGGPADARAQDVHVHGHRRVHDARGGARRRRWERLLRWHDDMLRGSSRPGEGRSSTRPATASSPPSTPRARRSTARSRSSVRCGTIATTPGSRIAVRIGLHTADANRRGDDYSGMGVARRGASSRRSPAGARSSPRPTCSPTPGTSPRPMSARSTARASASRSGSRRSAGRRRRRAGEDSTTRIGRRNEADGQRHEGEGRVTDQLGLDQADADRPCVTTRSRRRADVADPVHVGPVGEREQIASPRWKTLIGVVYARPDRRPTCVSSANRAVARRTCGSRGSRSAS